MDLRPLDEVAAIVFVDIALIIVVARLAGALFRKLRQPAVVGEIIAGILLGPTLVGHMPGHLDARLFPADVTPFLSVIAQLGLVIFMFIVGLELDLNLIRGKERLAGMISISSIALPFVLGIALASALYANHQSPTNDRFLPFALFIGAAMSITAFPVLARILTERGMQRIDVGVLALACAAVDDIVAWSLLAFVIAIVESSGVGDLPRILGLSLVFVIVMFAVVKPQLARLGSWYRSVGRLTPNMLAVVLAGLLVSAWATAEIGIHQIFGAFLFGVIMPREETAAMFHEILERLENVTVLLLLPVFFVVTGLRADVSGIDPGGLWQLGLILVVACAGKFLGAAGAARAQGVGTRKAAVIGTLMNTRGLTELVILNVGLEKGVLDPSLFTLLVVMAVVTTVMTEPLLGVIYPDRILERDVADAERARVGDDTRWRALAFVDDAGSDPIRAATALGIAVDIAATHHGGLVLSRFIPTAQRLEVGSGLGAGLSDMASSLGALHDLAGASAARGVPCSVLSRFSDDIPRDLVAQGASIASDLVLLTCVLGDDATVELTAAAAAVLADGRRDCAVLAMSATATSSAALPVSVVVGDEYRDAAAVEFAAAAARSRRVALQIVRTEGRRTSRSAEKVAHASRAIGLNSTVSMETDAAPVGLVVATLPSRFDPYDGSIDACRLFAQSSSTHAPLLLVRPAVALSSEGAAARLDRLTRPTRSSDGASGTRSGSA